MDRNFGFAKEHHEIVQNFINVQLTRLPKMELTQLRIVMQGLYEQYFGLNPYLRDKNHPLAMVEMKPWEISLLTAGIENHLDEYLYNGWGEIWKLSYAEFRELPHYLVEIMRGRVKQYNAKKKAITDDLEGKAGKIIVPSSPRVRP